MEKTSKIIIVVAAVFALLIAVLGFLYVEKQKEVILFYGETCPHCEIVEDFIKDNAIEQKVKIIQLEVFKDAENAAKMQKIAVKCKIDSANLGVPMAYTGRKCYIGDVDAIEMLKTKSGVSA